MPNLPALATVHFVLCDEIATEEMAARLACVLLTDNQKINQLSGVFPSLQFDLVGDLGAGKTTFVRALLRACGYQGRVKSPTYTLCEPYTLMLNANATSSSVAAVNKLQVYHFDLYRLSDPREWEEAGFRDYLNCGALCLIEWPERAQLALPDLRFTFTYQDEGRILTVEAGSESGQYLLNSLNRLNGSAVDKSELSKP